VFSIHASVLRGLRLLAGVSAVSATAVFVAGIAGKSWTASTMAPASAVPATSSAVAQMNSQYPLDDRGFVNSKARCDAPLTAAAMVRTDRSLVAICIDQSKAYQYRGVRLSDGAPLAVPAENVGPREFFAHNNGIDYQLGTEQLVITSGTTLIRREPVLEYKESHSFSAEAPPTPNSPSPSATARPSG
jgi:hypothetical protein